MGLSRHEQGLGVHARVEPGLWIRVQVSQNVAEQSMLATFLTAPQCGNDGKFSKAMRIPRLDSDSKSSLGVAANPAINFQDPPC